MKTFLRQVILKKWKFYLFCFFWLQCYCVRDIAFVRHGRHLKNAWSSRAPDLVLKKTSKQMSIIFYNIQSRSSIQIIESILYPLMTWEVKCREPDFPLQHKIIYNLIKSFFEQWRIPSISYTRWYLIGFLNA